jgi:hypothetical protein
MPHFCVEKKNATLRLILDCRWLNGLGAKPPNMHLPGIHDVLKYLLKNEWAAQVDATSWFYQFLLGTRVAKYFGARLAGHRGLQLIDVVITKMPMGWSWAPALGQRVSNVLARGIGLCWVDNTFLAARTELELRQNIEELKTRFVRANVKADLSTLQPSQTIEALGVEVDLVAKTFCMAKKWIDKIDPQPIQSTMSLRQLYCHLGTFLWALHVRQTPLCRFPHVMQAMSLSVKGQKTRWMRWFGKVR